MSLLLEIDAVHVVLAAREVVKGVSLSVARGEIVALLGPNGAGKSSLMRAGLGLIATKSGRVRIFGADARSMLPDLRARRAAYLPQRPESVWPVRVDALAALGRFAHGAAPGHLHPHDSALIDAALAACSLTELRARRMDELSGGERVRAHLARALAQNAPLLALDEPTAGLDPAQSLSVAEILQKHAQADGGVLLTTHDVALAARVAGRIVLMREGAAIASGPPRETLTPENLAAAYGRRGRLLEADGALAAAFE